VKFDLKTPCSNCPFRREGGVRLYSARVIEIAGGFLSNRGGDFPCHKTVDHDDDDNRITTKDSQHCAGALIFAEKNENQTQMMRISERLRLYDPASYVGHELVFDDLDEMLETAVDRNRRRPQPKEDHEAEGTRPGGTNAPARARASRRSSRRSG